MKPSERMQPPAPSLEPDRPEAAGRAAPLGISSRAGEPGFELLVERSPLAMALVRPGDVLYANAAALRLLGGRAGTGLLARRAEAVLRRARSRDAGAGELGRAGAPHVEQLRERIVHLDGRIVALELSAGVVEWRGAPAVQFVLIDVSDRVQDAEEERRLEAQLQHAQRLESLGRLAGGIAHDFNDLLTRILAHAELAGAELGESSPAREHLAALESAALRGAAITAQMQTFAGTTRVEMRPVDLSRLVDELHPLLQASLRRKVELREHLAPELPAIEADPGQLEQLIANLVANAADAIGERAGTIGISTGVMEAGASYLATTVGHDGLPAGTYVYVVVSDTGSGIDEAIEPRVFEPFFTTRPGRSGLGLAAAMGVVRRHGGAIKLESRPGEGTTVRVLLPASGEPLRPREELRPLPLEATAPSDAPSGAGVLLVDDEEGVRRALRLGLERAGYRVLEAEDGRRALELCRARGSEIDVILLDYEMPGLGGDEVLARLPRGAGQPRVLVSSGHARETVLARFPLGSIDGLLEKPYGPQTLIARLREILEG
ncbi:MAG TPA: ATP-binding protein [Myxococcota bacterium]|nr:ATP-binding protein [Myxococcota bacterium]